MGASALRCTKLHRLWSGGKASEQRRGHWHGGDWERGWCLPSGTVALADSPRDGISYLVVSISRRGASSSYSPCIGPAFCLQTNPITPNGRASASAVQVFVGFERGIAGH